LPYSILPGNVNCKPPTAWIDGVIPPLLYRVCQDRMPIDRREFVLLPGAIVAGSLFAAPADVPWQRKIRRVGQVNMTEHDPVAMNVEEWADYWASLKVDAVLVSVTGILAF